MSDFERLETPKQLAARIGLSEGQVRQLVRARQLEHVMIGSRVFVPEGAYPRFLEAKKVRPCQDETKVQKVNPLAEDSFSRFAICRARAALAAAAALCPGDVVAASF